MSFGLPEGEGQLSYGDYLRIADLLTLQGLRSQPAQHDETLFIVIHQVYELWFKQLLHEIDAAVARLGRDEVLGANRLLRRGIEIQRVLVEQIKVLETMTPLDFLAFRDHIMPASGFQSAQFREIEFTSGVKDAHFLALGGFAESDRARLQARFAAPSLADAFAELLRRRGFDVPADDAAVPDAEREQMRRRRLASLIRIYREAEHHYDLFVLAETLIEYDEMWQLWRFRHVQMVERVIGAKPGTGGSEGAAYLRTTVDRRFFPELWAMRNDLSLSTVADAGGESGAAPPGTCPISHG